MKRLITLSASLVALALSLPAAAQNGLSDDRVSLPDGPGSIGGVGENINVNANMGSASFDVAFRFPTGQTEGTTPDLKLQYSSGAGLDVAGIGWGLPLMAVERTVSKGLPTYSTSDIFAADRAEELSFVREVAGTREYRSRFEGAFFRYRWHDAGAGEAGYWTAESPDGDVFTYGATADGTLVASSRVQDAAGRTFKYLLVEMRDNVGRRVVYTYTKNGNDGWPLLDEVQYGFGTTDTPYFTVRAAYESRPDVMTNATSGAVIRLSRRLSSLEVRAQNAVIRRYLLTYEEEAQSGGMSRLARISEFGRDGGKTPIEHSFQYSRSLAGVCTIGCEQPFMVDMGTLQNGVSIDTGRASLIDINGDTVPDIVASDDQGLHRFYIATLDTNGRPTFNTNAAGVVSSMGNTSLRFVIGSPSVQLFDVNGDGFVDIIDKANATALCNFGTGDWVSEGCVTDPSQLPNLADDPGDDTSNQEPLGIRFFDFDNDKKIDLLQTASAAAATVFRNTGSGYVAVSVSPLEAQFDVDSLELTDLNGDGLQDPAILVDNNDDTILRFKTNLGFGVWEPAVGFQEATIAGLGAVENDQAVIEDLDGDGLSDVVVVSGEQVSYWRNRNNGLFDARVTITTNDIEGQIPTRDATQTVLFADMNGNGTDDVVWVGSNGRVQFLELFPVRPNLLAQVDNGIGWIRTVTYGTSSAERARDEGTADAWSFELPQAMQVVTATDTFELLTGSPDGSGLHEIVEYAYHEGFYDSAERAFRGYGRVEKFMRADADDGQEPGREVLTFDLGRGLPERAGLLLSQAVFGGEAGDVPIQETRSEFDLCDVDDIGAADVTWICPTRTLTIHQEGAAPTDWLTVETVYEHDGYGNQTLMAENGVIHQGPPETPEVCAPCTSSDGLHGGFCGPTCEGDERVTRTTYVVPGSDTGGAWLLRLPVVETVAANDAVDAAETHSFYDGPAFVGLPAGQATLGLRTRVMIRHDQSTLIPAERAAYSTEGDLASLLKPNGSPDDPGNQRRDFTYGDRALRVTSVTLHNGDTKLVQEYQYEASHLLVSEATDFVVFRGGVAVTPRNSTRYRYDEHARLSTLIRPGDDDVNPTESYTYDLASPVSVVTTRLRRGDDHVVSAQCLDGRGREVQLRTQIRDTEWLVAGFNEYNSRGQLLRSFQPFSSDTDQCDAAPPSSTLFSSTTYDILGRATASIEPDQNIYGVPSRATVDYAPLLMITHDAEDLIADGASFDTPLFSHFDGLGRSFRADRRLNAETAGTFQMRFDDRGHLAAVLDPRGNAQQQTFDLAGRMLVATNPNSGRATFTYDNNGNIISRTDARGVRVELSYDGLDRLLETFDAASPETTRQTSTYDFDEDCPTCVNGAGRLVKMSYPGGSDALGYDTRGRNIVLTRTLDGVKFETFYAFSGSDQLLSTTYPDGTVVNRTYDRGDRLASVPGIAESIAYDARGQIARIAHANTIDTTFEYDDVMRLVRHRSGAFFDVAYEFDRADNLVAAQSVGSGLSHAARYRYDAWYRPLQAVVGEDNETITTAFDVNDNIQSRRSSVTSSVANIGDFAYSAVGPNAVTTVGDTDYSYDAAGNVQSRGDAIYTWDAFGRLTAVDIGAGHSTSTYASDGTRVIKREDDHTTYYGAPGFVVRDGISTIYVNSPESMLGRLQSSTLAATVLPDQDGDSQIDITDAVLANDEVRGPLLNGAARRMLLLASSSPAILHTDRLGSIIAVSDPDGAVVAERSFYDFGEERRSTGFVDDFGFTGQERDELSGLSHHQFRFLDTRAGRWSSVDPAFVRLTETNVTRFGEATTGYAYVANSPVDQVDRTGLAGKKPKVRRTPMERIGHNLKSRSLNMGSRLFPPVAAAQAYLKAIVFVATPSATTIGKANKPGGRFNTLLGGALARDIQRVVGKESKATGSKPGRAVRIATSLNDAMFKGNVVKRAFVHVGVVAGGSAYLLTHVARAAVGLPNALAPSLLGTAQGALQGDRSLK